MRSYGTHSRSSPQRHRLKPHSRQRSARMKVVLDGLTYCQLAICTKKYNCIASTPATTQPSR
ncbi:hypothetical protein D9M68_843750 [compost metagenome]